MSKKEYVIPEEDIVCSMSDRVFASGYKGRSHWFVLPWLHGFQWAASSITTGDPFHKLEPGDKITVYIVRNAK